MGSGTGAEVVCIGVMVADVAVKPFVRLPARGLVERVGHIGLRTGGDALNESVVASRLGIRTRLIGKVGDDHFGRFLLRELKREHVETTGVVVDRETSTSACIVFIDDEGERSFLFFPGASDELCLSDVDFDLIRGARCISVGSAGTLESLEGESLARLLQRAREAGAETFLDFVWDEGRDWEKRVGPAIAHVSYLVPSYDEAAQLTGKTELGEIARALHAMGATRVIIKCGAKGAFVYSPGEAGMENAGRMVEALRVKAVDTTGAGDSFVGGLMSGMVRGMDLVTAVRFANTVAALVVQRVGANEGAPTIEEASRLYEVSTGERLPVGREET